MLDAIIMKWPMSLLMLSVCWTISTSFQALKNTLHLRLQPSLHTLVENEHLRATLPRDGAPNASILRQVVSVNTQRAVNHSVL